LDRIKTKVLSLVTSRSTKNDLKISKNNKTKRGDTNNETTFKYSNSLKNSKIGLKIDGKSYNLDKTKGDITIDNKTGVTNKKRHNKDENNNEIDVKFVLQIEYPSESIKKEL
jgi:DNA helicase TIP49 (TBP-interacting protein)